MTSIDTVIDTTLSSLSNSDYSNFDSQLKSLGQLINSSTSQNITTSSDQINKILNYQPDVTSVENLRLYRGLLILIRNMTPNLDVSLISTVISSFERIYHFDKTEWVIKLIETYCQILANFKRCDTTHEIEQINHLFKWFKVDTVSTSPIIHFLFRQFNTLDPETTNENLLTILRTTNDNYLMDMIFDIFNKIDFSNDTVSHDDKLFIHLLYDIITHESFEKWITNQSQPQKWIELSSVIVQTKDDWNNYELAALLSWNYSLFMAHSSGELDVNDENREMIISGTLQILAELSKFNATKQFMDHYSDFLPRLIIVFKVIHDNIKAITIKTSGKIEELAKYPSVKSYIIVILSYLCFESFETQEKIRELGGLALVLSNCVIDNNNPFIKEQAILCLKYLLAKNPKNQQFVADLEAKKTVDDEVLQEVGYQVEVIDGKVTIKKKES
ncbi:CTR86 Copper transport protein 86 [Candida maltosa Xu316]|uniref:Ataxin-10 homolog n=1 Tax=Candida maltosa (strain Xu316) TaxID=1245528 RepID=M3JUF9_CANMX|nr:hypothetical protein G210_3240 [Candida maltosa Xu316]